MKLFLFNLSTSMILLSLSQPVWSSRTNTDPSNNPNTSTSNPSTPTNTNPTPTSTPTTTNPSPTPTNNPASTNTARFTCETINNQNTVVYHPQNRPTNESYPWAIPSNMGGGWNSLARCQEISRRLEAYRPDGLQDLRISKANGYNIICVTTQKNSDCRIVLTVPQKQDPVTTRDRIFQNLTLADSGQRTEGVTTFNENNSSNGIDGLLNSILKPQDIGRNNPLPSRIRDRREPIDLRPFLSVEDGGFGTYLNNPTPNNPPTPDNSSPYRLNPDNFR